MSSQDRWTGGMKLEGGGPKERGSQRMLGPSGWERWLKEERTGIQVLLTTTHLHQSLEKMNIEQKMSIRILK